MTASPPTPVNRYTSQKRSFRTKKTPLSLPRSNNKKVAQLLTDNNLGPYQTLEESLKTIEVAHPIGATQTRDGGQQLIARFFNRNHRNMVVQKAKSTINKGGAPPGNKLRVVEDMIKADFELKRRAYKQMKEAYEKGKKTRFTKGKLFMDGVVVPIADL